MASDEEIVAYVLHKLGCTHPFKLSRVLALADIESMEKYGRRLTGLRYVPGPGTFYIEGLKEMFESSECFAIHKGNPETGRRGCVEYVCEPPRLGVEERRILDSVIEKYSRMDEMELNRTVVSHPLYRRLAGLDQD